MTDQEQAIADARRAVFAEVLLALGVEAGDRPLEELRVELRDLAAGLLMMREALGIRDLFLDRAGSPSFGEWDEAIRHLPETSPDVGENVVTVLWPRFVSAFCLARQTAGESWPALTEEARADVEIIFTCVRRGATK